MIWNKLQPQTLCESNDIYINDTLFEVLHYDCRFSIQEEGIVDINMMNCFFKMSAASKIQSRSGLESWDKENMIQGIRAVCNKEMGCLAAAKK